MAYQIVLRRSRRCNRLIRAAAAIAVALAAGCTVPRWPVEGPLTPGYGIRFRGIVPSIHHGVDIYVPAGTPIRAMNSGVVTHAGASGSYGLAVVIDHGGSVTSLYAHLSRVDVQRGERVESRSVIGLSGQAGNATGPHLHFEIRRYGRTEDPVPLLGAFPGSG